MSTPQLNLILALCILGLVLYISWSHLRAHGVEPPLSLLGATVLALAIVTVLTSVGRVFDVDREITTTLSAFMRGVALALLGGYALFRYREP